MSSEKTYMVVYSYLVTERVLVRARSEDEAYDKFWCDETAKPHESKCGEPEIERVEEVDP